MMEIQAKIGRIQLTRMQEWNDRRVKIANRIWETAENIKGLMSHPRRFTEYSLQNSQEDGIVHAAYKCYLFVDPRRYNRNKVIKEVNKLGVPCYMGSCPEVYLEGAFKKTGNCVEKRLPIAKRLGETSLMFLCHPTLTEEEITLTCDVIRKVFK